jgi:hypothetical protein
VWDQSYGYHLEVASDRTPGANLAKVLSTMGDRDAIVLLAGALALAALALGRRAAPPPSAARGLTSPDGLLLSWVGATVVVLLIEHPMWRPHVSQLVPGIALLAARHRPSWRVLAVAALIVAPYHLVHAWGVLQPDGYSDSAARAVDLVRDLPDDALAISDDPGLVWRAGHRPPGAFADPSFQRIDNGDITVGRLARAAAASDVCGVLVTSLDHFGRFRTLPDRLTAAGYLPERFGKRITLYARPGCESA